MQNYDIILENHILPYFGDCDALHEQAVQAFVLQKLERGLSIKTVKDILIVLKMVMKFGVKNEWMIYYEWDIKYPTTSTNKELEVLSVGNHRKILNHIQSHFTFTGLGIYISLSTGLRIGEICALKWSDINVVDGTITVSHTIERIYIIEGEKKHTELVINTPKTKNSCREIPMSKELLAMIKPLKKVVNDNFYVLTNDERPTEHKILTSTVSAEMPQINRSAPVIRHYDISTDEYHHYHVAIPEDADKIIRKECSVPDDNPFVTIENVQKTALLLFAEYLDGATSMAVSGGGGGGPDMSGWGKDKDEDEHEWARRCAQMAKHLCRRRRGLHR